MATSLIALPPVPPRVCESNTPRYGRYQGTLANTSLQDASHFAQINRLHRLASQKRWQWFSAFSPQVAIGGALVRLGYMCQGFFWVFDRTLGTLVCEESFVLPPGVIRVTQSPQRGLLASTSQRGLTFEIERLDDTMIQVILEHQSLGAILKFHAPTQGAMTAICPQPDRRTNVTIKQSGVHTSGLIRLASGESWNIDPLDGWGFLDYSHGLLPYHTSWKWAIGAGLDPDGARVGFNLIDGFNQGYESALWHNGNVYQLPEASISKLTNQTWQARAHHVDLRLHEEGVRAEEIDFKLLSSSYLQPLGRWEGQLGPFELTEGVGVAEEHEVRW